MTPEPFTVAAEVDVMNLLAAVALAFLLVMALAACARKRDL